MRIIPVLASILLFIGGASSQPIQPERYRLGDEINVSASYEKGPPPTVKVTYWAYGTTDESIQAELLFERKGTSYIRVIRPGDTFRFVSYFGPEPAYTSCLQALITFKVEKLDNEGILYLTVTRNHIDLDRCPKQTG